MRRIISRMIGGSTAVILMITSVSIPIMADTEAILDDNPDVIISETSMPADEETETLIETIDESRIATDYLYVEEDLVDDSDSVLLDEAEIEDKTTVLNSEGVHEDDTSFALDAKIEIEEYYNGNEINETESNNSFATANVIPVDTVVNGALGIDNDEDYYKFRLDSVAFDVFPHIFINLHKSL